MSDRLLVQEFPPLALVESSGSYAFDANNITDYRPLAGTSNQYWVHESKLDLSGYNLQGLTMYFRRSFSQFASEYNVQYTIAAATAGPSGVEGRINPYDVNAIEQIMVSSVPMTDAQLSAMVLGAPAFTPFPILDPGNFNRNHIIHGERLNHGLNTTLAQTTNLTTSPVDVAGYLQIQDDNYFSSLEATASDCLYCYRVIYLTQPRSGAEDTGIKSITFPACRVILDSATAQEDEIEYLMRLKRSYELANQV